MKYVCKYPPRWVRSLPRSLEWVRARCVLVIRRPALGPCWEWSGARTKNGYGHFKLQGRMVYAHRYVCALRHGPFPRRAPYAGHQCENKACCNPEHLEPVSQPRNMLYHYRIKPQTFLVL